MLSDVVAVHFDRLRAPDAPCWDAHAMVTFGNGQTEGFQMNGNAYLMNDDGKTIATFAKEAPPDEAWNYQFTVGETAEATA